MRERQIKYFRIITQTTRVFKYLVEMFNLGDQSSDWNYLYQSDSKDDVIAKISDYVIENNTDYRLINDSSTSNFDYSILEKEIIRKRKMQDMTPIKTAKSVNYDFKIYCNKNSYIIHTNGEQIAEATEIIEAFAFVATQIKKKNMKSYKVFIILGGVENQFVEFDPDLVINTYGEKINYGDEDDTDDSVVFSESSEDCKDYDDEEICKDLMLDEVISSQKLEINRLLKIIEDQHSYIVTLHEHSSHMAKELMSAFQKMVSKRNSKNNSE